MDTATAPQTRELVCLCRAVRDYEAEWQAGGWRMIRAEAYTVDCGNRMVRVTLTKEG